jgi:LPXTG-motif cell wall-anchored protein
VLNASTGELIWKYLTSSIALSDVRRGHLVASPAVANGDLYISTEEGTVVAFGNKPANITPTPLPLPPDASTPNLSILVSGLIIILGLFLLILFVKRKKT